jgi:hypothetical protein
LRYLEMNQHDALYRAARKYPGGVEIIAHRMDKSANVLRNKLRPDIHSHHVTFEEATEILELCHAANVKDALQAAHAFNARLGLVAFAAPALTETSDEALLETVYKVMKQIGAVAQSVAGALEDKKITHAELDEIEKSFGQGMSALGEWRERVRARAEADSGPVPSKKAKRE